MTRLKGLMNLLVSYFHGGGMEGRQIHEGILVVKELLDSRLKSKHPWVGFKLDFGKAFD